LLDPAATDVQPDIPSPILPQPFVSILTLLDPDAIGAACAAQGGTFGGNRCDVLLSPSRDMPIPSANTLLDPAALVMPEQCATSASPILVTAGIIFPFPLVLVIYH
tara:strand:+ start:750 stop:1067 length:318 start_codon:yes stop_codon:yes gene_type:complete